MGGYLIAHTLHMSGPLTMVAAGIVIGNYGKRTAMSATTKDYLNKFWELVNEIMNAILFLFIGFELLLIPHLSSYWIMGGIALLGVVLLARFISIWLPVKLIPFRNKFSSGTIKILVWGGLARRRIHRIGALRSIMAPTSWPSSPLSSFRGGILDHRAGIEHRQSGRQVLSREEV